MKSKFDVFDIVVLIEPCRKFTMYKEYYVYKNNMDSEYDLLVTNDDNLLRSMRSSDFITKQEYRKIKLEKICSK